MNIYYDITHAAPSQSGTGSFNHLIDMRPLMFVAAMVGKMLTACFDRRGTYLKDRFEDDLWAYRKRVDRVIIRAKLHNFKTRLKWAMLGDVDWRERVTDELGGATGLENWEARQASYKTRQAERDLNPLAPRAFQAPDMAALHRGEVEPRPEFKPVPMDNAEWFRLAPIGRVMRGRVELTEDQRAERREAWRLRRELRRALWNALTFEEKYKPGPSFCHREMLHDLGELEDWVFDIKPIPVTPEELRHREISLIGELEGRGGVSRRDTSHDNNRSFESRAYGPPQDEVNCLRMEYKPPPKPLALE